MKLLKRYVLRIYFILMFLFAVAVNITTAQVININTNPLLVTTVYGEATSSTSTTFTVSGIDMLADILVTPPTAFEVSLDNITFTNTLAIPLEAGGVISPRNIYIRLKAITPAGIHFGNITLSSAGTSVNATMPNSTVTRANLRIEVSDNKIYGETLTDFIASDNGTNFSNVNAALKNEEKASTLDIKYTAGNLPTAPVGTYVGGVQGSNLTGTFSPSNYNITYLPGNVTVTPAPLIATADNKSKIIGEVNPVFTITYNGFVNDENATQLITQPIVTTTATQYSDVGVYPIIISGGSSPNYTLSYVSGMLTVDGNISVPNTFTPNGDGVNDVWSITNLNPNLKITVEIMNRYGTRVYFSSGNSASWDGYSNGVPVPFGVYYYVIKGVKEKPLTGYITVVR